MQRKGGPKIPDAVLQSAREHRDEAEANWRAARAREPHPIGKRLRWAAFALEATIKLEDNRRVFELFEEEVRARREELVQRAAADEARTRKKREMLDEIRRETDGDELDDPNGQGRRIMQRLRNIHPSLWATRSAVEGIATDVGPVLETIIGTLPEGDEARDSLQGVLSAVTGVYAILEQSMAEAGTQAQHFDIAGGDRGPREDKKTTGGAAKQGGPAAVAAAADAGGGTSASSGAGKPPEAKAAAPASRWSKGADGSTPWVRNSRKRGDPSGDLEVAEVTMADSGPATGSDNQGLATPTTRQGGGSGSGGGHGRCGGSGG